MNRLYPNDIIGIAKNMAEELKIFLTEKESKYKDFPLNLFVRTISSMAFVESGDYRNPEAGATHEHTGDNGKSIGLMQVQRNAKNDVEDKVMKIIRTPFTSLNDTAYNIKISIGYLLYQYYRYDENMDSAVVSYNRGHIRGLDNQGVQDFGYLQRQKTALSKLTFPQLDTKFSWKYALFATGAVAVLFRKKISKIFKEKS